MTSAFTFDLTVPAHAYAFGFMQADGHLRQGVGQKGALTVELQRGDAELLEKISALFQVHTHITYRERDTNFKKNSKSAIWQLCDLEVRTVLNSLGLPYGRKAQIVTVPEVPFSRPDYFRGHLDANGSLGLTGKNRAFASWCIVSPALKDHVIDYLREVTGETKQVRANTRDGVYNIVSFDERAQALVAAIYYDGCLALARKKQKAQEVLAWTRPDGVMKNTWESRRWAAAEDEYAQNHTVEEAAAHLNRTVKSVELRRYRLARRRWSR